MIKPMLAHKVNENKIDFSEKVFIQPKLDGVRCIFTKDGAYSRTGKEFKNVAHIKEDLIDFFRKYPEGTSSLTIRLGATQAPDPIFIPGRKRFYCGPIRSRLNHKFYSVIITVFLSD